MIVVEVVVKVVGTSTSRLVLMYLMRMITFLVVSLLFLELGMMRMMMRMLMIFPTCDSI